ncbi:hypothetical protein Ga0123461_0523 [Mariprofundus aestuarium]|uniref:Uncharacterized protein n=1 Tax=Mariprofundus aestuarium TaxID=1921086 RepID=A0A2K8KVV4_MARES|nr:hypothetical protein [Mariprofundus aestuarium]ATX78960.1 hypothetical protein Ga0123461_0523 [Mariprofundus aestuarium]
MRNMLLLAAFAVLFSFSVVHVGDGLSVAVPAAEAKKAHKVDVCHIPPGNPSNAHTINIDQSAVDAHLAHGDYLGECGAVVVEDNSNDNESNSNDNESNSNDNESNSNDNESNSNDNESNSNDNESKDNDNESQDKVTVCHVSKGGGSDNESKDNSSDNESKDNSSDNESKDNSNDNESKDSGSSQTTSVQALEISASALDAHLAHGDIEGACPTTPTCFLCGTGGPGDGTCICPDGKPGSFVSGPVSGPAATPERIRSIQGE